MTTSDPRAIRTCDSQPRIHTYERTDETEISLTDVGLPTVVDARGYDGLESIGDVLARPSLADVRHPRIRSGETAYCAHCGMPGVTDVVL